MNELRFIFKHLDREFFITRIKSIVIDINSKQLIRCFEAAILEKVFDKRLSLLLCMNGLKKFELLRGFIIEYKAQRKLFNQFLTFKIDY